MNNDERTSEKSVDFDIFLEWAKRHFDGVKVRGGKVRLNSIYCNHLGGDTKGHLWCRPYTGYYHCYKSGKRDSLYGLVCDVERCSYTEAVEILGGEESVRYLEAKLKEFFATGKLDEPAAEKSLELPAGCVSVRKLQPPHQEFVLNYLSSRKLPPEGLHYCRAGEYQGRIVIPYYDPDGKLVYFNARDITNRTKLRYRGPEAGTGFKKDEVVWMSFFPRKGRKIYLTEGEFDAMTLNLCGLHGCATGGKEVSPKQIEVVRQYEICLSFDTDPSGREAFRKLGWRMYEQGVKKVTFVRPAAPYKDWNEMLTGSPGKPALDPKVIRAYIVKNEKPFDEFTSSLLNV